jgi:hypothetical protein
MKVVTVAPPGQWLKASNAYEKLIAKAETLAVRGVSKKARDAGKAVIQGAGFSGKFASTLVIKFIPSSGYSLSPAAYIHSTINYADVFEKGATIAGAPYIWLPLPNVPAAPGRPHMTPKQYAQSVGPLVTMHRAGKPPMLGARIGALAAEPIGTFRGQVLRRLRRSGIARTQTIPLFVGILAVNIPRKFDTSAAFKRVASEENITKAYESNLDEYVDPNGD